MNKKLLFIAFLLHFSLCCFANNLVISNVSLSGGNRLNFQISWDNSWRLLAAPANHDAIWLFIKRRDCASIDWRHQNLSSTASDHTFSSLLMATTTTDKKGIFIHRTDPGSGNISNVDVSVLLDNPPAGDYDYQVLGIEMVYVPEGAFEMGDGSGTNFAVKTAANASFAPYRVTTEVVMSMTSTTNIIPIGTNPQVYTYPGISCFGGGNRNLPGAYPKGFKAFYCMKYEISLGQYIDFLNAINGAGGSPSVHGYTTPRFGRNPVNGVYPFYNTPTPNRACDSLSWANLAAYLDWAALSPMTEFEYEKVCRGTNIAVVNEFAWSSNAYTDVDVLVNDGTSTEAAGIVAAGITNLDNDGTALGAFRCGFAATPTTFTRLPSGATFYGAMDMTGNVSERAISPDSGVSSDNNTCPDASAFSGLHGDGEIDGAGLANVAFWPNNLTESTVSFKGGSWNSPFPRGHVSDRALSDNDTKPTGRLSGSGGRGVRRATNSGSPAF